MSDLLQRLVDSQAEPTAPTAEAAERRWTEIVRRTADGLGPSVRVSTEGLPEAAAGAKAGLGLVAKITLFAVVAAGSGAVLFLTRDPGGGALAQESVAASPPVPLAPSPPRVADEPEPDAIPRRPPSATPVPQLEPQESPKKASPRREARPKKAVPAAATPSTLGEEARLLKQAWGALDAGALARASLLLARHRRTFPQGSLAHERRAAEAIVGCRGGKRQAGRAFIEAAPRSAYAGRVRAACEESE